MATTTVATTPKNRNRHLRMTCPFCGMTARASRTAMRRHGLPEHCGRPMHPDDIALAEELLPADELDVHDGYIAERRAECDRALRDNRRAAVVGQARPQCHGCRTFLTHHAQHCGRCGFHNGHGRYIEGTADLPW